MSGTQGPASLLGRVIGGYRLVRVLGKGATGVVFLGERTDGAERVFEQTGAEPLVLPNQAAIKLLVLPWQLEDAERTEFRKRFLREAETLSALKHPHILSVVTYGEDQATSASYMVLEYLTGGTLHERLAASKHPMPLDEAAGILSQIAEAVDYAHHIGVVHRDIKPGNILLDDQGQPFLSDFSIARLVVEATTRLTHTGMALGTPIYMSPEALAGHAVGPEGDIYSLGMVLYEMVTGLRTNATNPPTPPRSLRADLPVPAEAVILKAIAANPADRFASAEDLSRAFAEGIQGIWPAGVAPLLSGGRRPAVGGASDTTLPTGSRLTAARKQKRGRSALIAGLSVAATLLIVFSGLAYAVGNHLGPFGRAHLTLSGQATNTGGSMATEAAATASATARATQSKGSGGGGSPPGPGATQGPGAPPTATPVPKPPVAIYGDGSDGAFPVYSSQILPLVDAACTGSAGATSLYLPNGTSGFAAGKPVLIHQSQGAGAGTYLQDTIIGVSGSTLSLAKSLNATYSAGAQVIQLHQYTNVTIYGGATLYAPAWNGSTGGILAFLANGTVTINGTISMDRVGFRGGPAQAAGGDPLGYQGEGTAGLGGRSTSANGNGGGGGGNQAGLGSKPGGGGGGHAATGTPGVGESPQPGGAGGQAAGTSDLSAMVFGGGGGSGGDSTNGNGGGAGGGIIYFSGLVVNVTGLLTANGGPGENAGNSIGGAGGGAGGSILIISHSPSAGGGSFSVGGGSGGNGGGGGNPGGTGSGGRVWVRQV